MSASVRRFRALAAAALAALGAVTSSAQAQRTPVMVPPLSAYAVNPNMAANGLQFAPATPGDEPAYRSLYHARAAYDAGMTQTQLISQ